MLLDDVMSELDADRRGALVERLRAGGPGGRHDDGPRARAGRGRAGRARASRSPTERAAGGRSVRPARREAPRPAARAAAVARWPTASRRRPRLAAVQRVWPEAVGERHRRAGAAPRASATGVVTVSCSSSVWAQELTLMGPELVERLNAALGRRIGARAALRAAPAGAWARATSP